MLKILALQLKELAITTPKSEHKPWKPAEQHCDHA